MRLLLVKADDSTRHTIVVLLRNVATNVSEIEPPAHVPQPHQRLVLRRRCFLKLSLPKGFMNTSMMVQKLGSLKGQLELKSYDITVKP
ncbi:uncharacterized protein [Malus domestica]|uniref:uncharacterized protein isoform X3 n=1 Tax=Malus domestica TaxID=3750 RepID=UPI0039751D74